MDTDNRADESKIGIGWGFAGGHVLAQYIARNDSTPFDSLFVNTCRTDLRNIINNVKEYDTTDYFIRHSLEFGSTEDGILATNGRQNAQTDIDRIFDRLDSLLNDEAEIIHIGALGGGTTGGALPYIAEQLSTDDPDYPHSVDMLEWLPNVNNQTAIVIWPFSYEAPQYHFNTITGLATLLRADIGTITICANEVFTAERARSYEEINAALREWIDINHSKQEWVAGDNDNGSTRIITPFRGTADSECDFSSLLDRAASHELAESCIQSARRVNCVVCNPAQNISSELTTESIKNTFREWCQQHQVETIGDATFHQGVTDQASVYLVAVDPHLTSFVTASSDGYEKIKRRRLDTDHIDTDQTKTWENQVHSYVQGSPLS